MALHHLDKAVEKVDKKKGESSSRRPTFYIKNQKF